MKVLTLKQPWASFVMQGDKKYEFRSWKTKYRGELLIHAGKGIDKEELRKKAEQFSIDKTIERLNSEYEKLIR